MSTQRHPLDDRADRYMRRTFGYVDRHFGWRMIRLNIACSDLERDLRVVAGDIRERLAGFAWTTVMAATESQRLAGWLVDRGWIVSWRRRGSETPTYRVWR